MYRLWVFVILLRASWCMELILILADLFCLGDIPFLFQIVLSASCSFLGSSSLFRWGIGRRGSPYLPLATR